MTKSKKVAQRDVQQQNKLGTRQLSVTDLNQVAHGEQRSNMRSGFYTRHHRSSM